MSKSKEYLRGTHFRGWVKWLIEHGLWVLTIPAILLQIIAIPILAFFDAIYEAYKDAIYSVQEIRRVRARYLKIRAEEGEKNETE